MDQGLAKLSHDLLSRLRLSVGQAAVLVDETSAPETFRVYVFDKDASRRCPAITEWFGHPVDVVRDVTAEPHSF